MSALRRILFVDRDGTLIEEPPDEQVDSYEKLRLVPGVVPALLRLRAAGYELVMVSNQDGLGSEVFPRERFDGPQRLLLQVLASQGIEFAGVHIDASREGEGSPTRKPEVGMALPYVREGRLDFAASAMVGDRDSDLEFARRLGVRAFRVGARGEPWGRVADALLEGPRSARHERTTHETRVRIAVELDREAPAEVATGIAFLDHMLEQLARHGGFALTLTCAGDTHVDEHHSVEDSALALGETLRMALGDRRGISRYGDSAVDERGVRFALPMDEARAEALLDLSGRPYCRFEGRFAREYVGDLPTELVAHFFRSLADGLRATLHVRVEGENTHHMVEAAFKALARAWRMAARREAGAGIPSTKGVL